MYLRTAMPNLPSVFRGLTAKFLIVVVPLSLALSVLGASLLVSYDVRNAHDSLAARIGNKAARVTTLLSRYRGLEDDRFARDLLSLLASDRAFQCAELRIPGEERARVTMPSGLDCASHNDSKSLTLPVGELGAASLTVRFTDSELVEYKAERYTLTQFVMGLGFLFPVLATIIGFRLIVNRPLRLLH